MKFLLQIVAIFVAGYLSLSFFPWWIIALVAFVFGYALKSRANFMAGFLGIGLLWLMQAWITDSNAAAPLAEKISGLFMLNKTLLFLVTVIVGGLVGGFGALTGSLLREKKKSLY